MSDDLYDVSGWQLREIKKQLLFNQRNNRKTHSSLGLELEAIYEQLKNDFTTHEVKYIGIVCLDYERGEGDRRKDKIPEYFDTQECLLLCNNLVINLERLRAVVKKDEG